MNKIKNTIQKMGKMAPVNTGKQPTLSGKDSYKKFHKSGPQLMITKILMVNGPLTSKEIWRIYERNRAESRERGSEIEQYWGSLTKMKETLKFMRINQKIKSSGYSYRDHIFQGWKVQQKRALKYVHPAVINQIQQDIQKRDNL